MEKSYELPTIIAIDDWMIWGRDIKGQVVQTCAELWPEWLDYDKPPEDMEIDEYRCEVLRILGFKRPAWYNTVEWIKSRDLDDPDAITLVMEDIHKLECEQHDFIAAHFSVKRMVAA